MNDTVIIIGDSPFLKSVEDKIPFVLYRFYTIGINNVISKFHTNEHIFQDWYFSGLSNLFPNVKTVSIPAHRGLIKKENKELIHSFTFDFEKDTEIFKINKLAWCGFTHDYAISYCIHKGYKNIVLIGAADFEGGYHYSDQQSKFKCSELFKLNSKRFIEEICTKKANIMTCNPNSILNIEKICIDDLLR